MTLLLQADALKGSLEIKTGSIGAKGSGGNPDRNGFNNLQG